MQHFGLSVRYILLPVLIALLASACSNTKYLASNEILLRKNEVSISSEIDYRKIRRNIEENASLESKLATLARQQPNKKTLGLVKLNLSIYNRYYTNDSTGIYHWIINTIGEPPVLFDTASLAVSATLMHEYMVSKGYLLSDEHYDFAVKRKELDVAISDAKNALATIANNMSKSIAEKLLGHHQSQQDPNE